MKRKTVIALCMLSAVTVMGSYSTVMAEETSYADEIPVTVFFDQGTTQEQIDQVEDQIRERNEVKNLEFISGEEAWEEFKDSYFQGSDVEEGFQNENPLAESSRFEVYTEQIEDQPELAEYIESLDHVRKVNCADMIEESQNSLKDGVYTADFDTDSNMFHVNETNDGKGTLTVKDGEMTIHVSLVSKSIVNLFAGTAEDAQKEGAEVLEPTEDEVTYSDGYKETVYGFDISVPALDEEFDVALLGKKGKWYDHKVSVSNPQPAEDNEETVSSAQGKTAEDLKLEDGDYTVEVALEGGSGKATVESPAEMKISDGKAVATITWSSPNYDYMIVDGEKYEMVNTEGNSVFEIPVAAFDTALEVKADTVAMSEPHEIDYTLQFDSGSVKKAE